MNRSKINNKLFSWPRALCTVVQGGRVLTTNAKSCFISTSRTLQKCERHQQRKRQTRQTESSAPQITACQRPPTLFIDHSPCQAMPPHMHEYLYDWSMHITTYRIAPRCARNCPPSCGQGSPICHHSHPSHQSPPQPDGKDPPTFIHMLCEWDTACVVLKVKNTCLKVQPTMCGASSKM
jgi:hypothetical protein